MNGNELVSIDKIDIVSFFTKDDDMDKILKTIREASCRDLVQEVDTAANRKAIASMAYRVSQSKTLLEKAGKDLVSEWKAKTQKIDVSRKKARDYLDLLRDEIRLPLTNWEIAEKEREEKERLDAELAEAWDAAHAEHELFLRQKAIEEKEAEIAAKQAEKDAIEAQKKHDEQVRQAAIEQAQIDAKKIKELEAEEKRQLIIQAEKEKAQAIADLKAKIEAEEQEKIAQLEEEKAIAEKKASNIAHQKKINRTALENLIEIEGVTEALGIRIITAIALNKIKYITINY